jgi:hypothetical protein
VLLLLKDGSTIPVGYCLDSSLKYRTCNLHVLAFPFFLLLVNDYVNIVEAQVPEVPSEVSYKGCSIPEALR